MNILSATKRLISILKKESQVQNIKEDISKWRCCTNKPIPTRVSAVGI
jgi:hypothetical protein